MTEALDAARSAYSKWYTIQSRVAVLANAFLILAQPVKLSTVSRRARIIPRAAPSRDWCNAGLGRDRPWRRGVDVLLHGTPRANQPPIISLRNAALNFDLLQAVARCSNVKSRSSS